MPRPSVNINLTNGGLNIPAVSENGTSAVLIASPIAPVAGYGVPFLIKTIAQAEAALGQVGNEDVLAAITDGFFAEAPEGIKLYVMCMAPATNLATLVAAVNAEKVLNMGAGAIRMLALIKFPPGSYVPTITDGFDQDVHAAVTAGQTLANTWFGKKKPFRVLVEGYAFADAAAAKDYATAANRNCFIVTANINDSTATAIMLALGRAAAMQPQQNIGRIRSGSLKIAETATVKIGEIAVDSMTSADLDTLYDKRYITIEKNQTDSGYVFTDDNALCDPTDDYNNLRYGRVVDNATRVTFSNYYQELKNDVDVETGGRLSLVVEKALESSIENAVENEMSGQLSKNADGTAAVQALVNPDPTQYAALYENAGISSPNFNLLQTGTVYIFVRMRPKGCLKFINVYLGYTAE